MPLCVCLASSRVGDNTIARKPSSLGFYGSGVSDMAWSVQLRVVTHIEAAQDGKDEREGLAGASGCDS